MAVYLIRSVAGIKLAKLSAMPESVTQEAEEISRELEEADNNQWKKKGGDRKEGDTGGDSSVDGAGCHGDGTGLDTTLDSAVEGDRRDVIINLADRVVTAVQSGFDEAELARFLGQLQRQTIYREGS